MHWSLSARVGYNGIQQACGYYLVFKWAYHLVIITEIIILYPCILIKSLHVSWKGSRLWGRWVLMFWWWRFAFTTWPTKWFSFTLFMRCCTYAPQEMVERSLPKWFRCTSNKRYRKTIFVIHDDVVKWKHFPCYWPFLRGIHRSPVNSPHKGQWRGALMFSLIGAWINVGVYNREAGDLRRHSTHYNVTVLCCDSTWAFRHLISTGHSTVTQGFH